MAASSPSFRDYMSMIKKGDFPMVNILMGEEPYYLDILVKAFENNVLEESDKDFNCHVFYGNDVDLELLVATARQYPIMADRKLVILKEAQSLERAKTQLERLSGYVENPNKSTVFVLVFKGDNLAATSELMKAASASKATVFKSPLIRDYKLSGPAKEYCDSKNIKIDAKAITMLCDYIGGPLSKLFGEIDKLIVAKGKDTGRITPEDIERNIGISKDYNNFELQKALSIKDYPKAIRIINHFAKNPKQNPGIVTVATIYKYFSQLLEVMSLQDRSDSNIVKTLGLKNSYAANDYKDGMRSYTFQQAVNAIHAMRAFDTKSKGIGSMQNETELMKELIFNIFTR